MLDAHKLNVFLIAAETLNFTLAAERLNMSQPSVSQHIQALERHFDTPLFRRAGRNIQLTDAGETLVPLAKDFVKQSIHTEETMISLKGKIYGHLLVSCSTTPGKYVRPHLLVDFHNQHPKVQVSCFVSSQAQSIEMLCNGDVHFALTSLSRDEIKEAEFQKFMTDPIILIAPPDHPWAKKKAILPEELYGTNFIMREETSGTQEAVRHALGRAGISTHDLQILMTLGNSEAIALSVKEGLGVGFISTSVLTILGEGSVIPIDILDVDISREIYIGHQIRHPTTAAQTAFRDSINNFEIPIISRP